MKTYILRPFHPVEPQYCRRTDPTTRAITSDILSRPAAPSTDLILYVGMDVHNDSIAVAIAPSRSTEVRSYGIIGGEHDDVLKLIRKLAAAHPGAVLQFCYEAGPRGYPLCRFIRRLGYPCIIVAPSKVRANRVRALLGQAPLLTQAEEQTWNPPADPDLDLPADPTPRVCSASLCPRCQQVMRLVGSWKRGQVILYPKRPP